MKKCTGGVRALLVVVASLGARSHAAAAQAKATIANEREW